MTSKQLLFNLYKKFFEQRSVLDGAPVLSMNANELTIEDFDFRLAEKEMSALVSYLLSVKDVGEMTVSDMLRIIKKGYEDQPFWKNLLIDYVQVVNQKEAERLVQEGRELKNKACQVLDEIRQEEYRRKMLVKTYAEQIQKQHFSINAERLMTSYFSMYRKNPQKAWETLITNPGYFSPIITTDQNGNTILTPEEAITENRKIAQFLKSLRV